MKDLLIVIAGCLIALGIHNFLVGSLEAYMTMKKRRDMYKLVDLRKDEDK